MPRKKSSDIKKINKPLSDDLEKNDLSNQNQSIDIISLSETKSKDEKILDDKSNSITIDYTNIFEKEKKIIIQENPLNKEEEIQINKVLDIEESMEEIKVMEDSVEEKKVMEDSVEEKIIIDESVEEKKTGIIFPKIDENNIEKIIIKDSENQENINELINESYLKTLLNLNKTIKSDLSNEFKSNEYINQLENKEFILNDTQINNILGDDLDINTSKKYTLEDLKLLFNQLKEAVIIVQIINGEIKFIEKKGNESRNQSVIELLIKANNYRKLPDIQFLIFTNDFINKSNIYSNPYIFTFLKKYNYKTNLFPNFNFNHWIESNIPSYDYIYNLFTTNNINWNEKKETIFWSGSNTNSIRKKIHESSKLYPNFNINLLDKNKNNFIPLDEILKYKYLLNMNGYSYAGRLNYLFLSKSCVIILKNIDKEEDYEEFFYSYFIPNEDYIEIKYNKNERGELIINRIISEIHKYDCEEMAKRCYQKALAIFKLENIYDYINDQLVELSKNNIINNKLVNSICFTPALHYFNSGRLNNNDLSFFYMGKDFEINLLDEESNIFNIKILNDHTKIKYNKINLYDKYTPYLLDETKSQHFQFLFEENKFLLILNKKFTIIKIELPTISTKFIKNEILSEFGGWWII